MTTRYITESVAVDLADRNVRAVDGWWDQHGGFGPADDPATWHEAFRRPDDEARQCFHREEG